LYEHWDNEFGPEILTLAKPHKTVQRVFGAEKLPFLILDDASNLDEWRFLSSFDVGADDNLNFYLDVLRCYKSTGSDFPGRLYEAIQRKLWEFDDAAKGSDKQAVQ
jgi:hypothetical protein